MALVTLNDEAGRPGVILSVLPDGRRAIALCDSPGAQGVWLGLDAEVAPGIVLQPTADTTNRVVVTVRPRGDAGLTIRDREGVARAVFSVDAHGQAGLALLDPEERPIARLELSGDQGPRLDFFGPHQGLIWRAPEGG